MSQQKARPPSLAHFSGTNSQDGTEETPQPQPPAPFPHVSVHQSNVLGSPVPVMKGTHLSGGGIYERLISGQPDESNNNISLQTLLREETLSPRSGLAGLDAARPSPGRDLPASVFSGQENLPSLQSQRPPLQEVRVLGAGDDHPLLNTVSMDEGDNEDLGARDSLAYSATASSAFLNASEILREPSNLQQAAGKTPSSSSAQSLSHERVHQLRNELITAKKTIYVAEQENKGLHQENEKLKAECEQCEVLLKDAQAEAQLQIDESEARARNAEDELLLLKNAFGDLSNESQSKLHSTIAEMEQWKLRASQLDVEKGKLEHDLLASQVSADAMKASYNQLRATFDEEKKKMDTTRQAAKKSQLQATERAEKVRTEAQAKEAALKEANAKLSLELDHCKAMLKEATRKNQIQEQPDSASSEQEKLVATLQQEVAQLRNDLTESEAARNRAEAAKKSLEEKLLIAQERQHQLQASMAAVATQHNPASPSGHLSAPNTGVQLLEAVVQEGVGDGGNDALSRHISRIKDAAERANFVEESKLKLDRLKDYYDKKIQRQEVAHSTNLERVLRDAKAEVIARTKENRRLIMEQFESRMSEVEARHQNEVASVKKAYQQKAEADTEKLEAAVADASSVADMLASEMKKRAELEKLVQSLQRGSSPPRSGTSSQHSEWSSLRRGWDDDTQVLLATIKHECDEVFHRSRNATVPISHVGATTKTISPRSVLDNPLSGGSPSGASIDESNRTNDGTARSSVIDHESAFYAAPQPIRAHPPRPSKQTDASAFHAPRSSFDRDLDETEAIVSKLLAS